MIGNVVVFHVDEHAIDDEPKEAQLNHLGIRSYPSQFRMMAHAPFESGATGQAKYDHRHIREQAGKAVACKDAEEDVVCVPNLTFVLDEEIGGVPCKNCRGLEVEAGTRYRIVRCYQPAEPQVINTSHFCGMNGIAATPPTSAATTSTIRHLLFSIIMRSSTPIAIVLAREYVNMMAGIVKKK